MANILLWLPSVVGVVLACFVLPFPVGIFGQQIALGDRTTCYIKSNKRVECVGRLSGFVLPDAAANFSMITVAPQVGFDHFVGLTQDGHYKEWGAMMWTNFKPTDTFIDVSCNYLTCCFVRTDGSLFCYSLIPTFVATHMPTTGTFKKIAVSSFIDMSALSDVAACALNTDGVAVCWCMAGFPCPHGERLATVSFAQATMNDPGYAVAGVRPDGSLLILNNVTKSAHTFGPPRTTEPSFLHISMATQIGIVIPLSRVPIAFPAEQSSADISQIMRPPLSFPASQASVADFFLSNSYACAVMDAGPVSPSELVCWGSNSDGQTAVPSIALLPDSLSLIWSRASGITADAHKAESFGATIMPDLGVTSVFQLLDGTVAFDQVLELPSGRCGLRSDTHTVECAHESILQKLPGIAGRSFTMIAGGGDDIHGVDDWICGLNVDKTISCFGNASLEGLLQPPTLQFNRVGGGHYVACGEKTDTTVECWGSNRAAATVQGAPSPWAMIAISNVHCAPYSRYNVLLGAYETFTECCALQLIQGSAYALFWDAQFAANTDNSHGPYKSISCAGDYACGIRQSDGYAECFRRRGIMPLDRMSPPPKLQQVPFVSIRMSDMLVCAVMASGVTECWGPITAPLYGWSPPHRVQIGSLAPIGQYREGIVLKPCRNGTFSAQSGHTNELCSGACAAGCFGTGSTSECAGRCPKGNYCPKGAEAPIPCPAGRFGAVEGLQTDGCSGECPEGFFCPLQSSGLTPCHPGYYGSSARLTTPLCDGPCRAGWYCPAGSRTDNATACGGVNVYCPPGSALPLEVPPGHYSTSLEDPVDTLHRTNISECEPGYYCTQGTKRVCPRGLYSDTPGTVECLICTAGFYGLENSASNTSTCSGPCKAGWYCPAGSFTNEALPCGGESVYCREGSAAPKQAPPGWYSISAPDGPDDTTHRVDILECEPGSICLQGVRQTCPKGFFANHSGSFECLPCRAGYFGEGNSTSELCSGPCKAGWYCPSGSTSDEAFACGGASVYCPEAAEQPLKVPVGFYSTPTDAAKLLYRTNVSACEPGAQCILGNRQACRPGTFSANSEATTCSVCSAGYYGVGESTSASCSGPCRAGFYCAAGSDTDTQLSCGGVSVYCPEGSNATTEVPPGFYSVPETEDTQHRINITTCSPGSYCAQGLRRACAPGQYSDIHGASVCQLCDPGHFGHGNSTSKVCSGVCAAGHWCPAGATSATAFVCGSADLYCPIGSAAPMTVSPGFFSLGGVSNDTLTATNQSACTKGHYCKSGRQYSCEKGTFTPRNQQQDACDSCPAGMWAPLEGATACALCEDGTFSSEKASLCTPCGAGTISARSRGSRECIACQTFSQPDNPVAKATKCLCNAEYYASPLSHLNTSTTSSPSADHEPDKTDPDAKTLFMCVPCPSGASCDQVGTTISTMRASAGYWRPSDASVTYSRCLHASHCPQGACAENRAGPLCAFCADGYHSSALGDYGGCTACPDQASSILGNLLSGALCILVVAVALVLVWRSNQAAEAQFMNTRTRARSSDWLRSSLLDRMRYYGDADTQIEAMENEFESDEQGNVKSPASFVQAGRILITFFQIVSALTVTINSRWPSLFSSVLSYIDVLNLNIIPWSSMSCLIDLSFYTRMWLMVLVPVVILTLAALLSLVPVAIANWRDVSDDPTERKTRRLRALKCIKLLLFAVFLIYPSMSSTSISMFQCRSVEGVSYMIRDMHYECGDAEWKRYVPLAAVFVLCFPIGIPLAFLFLLHRAHANNSFNKPATKLSLGLLYEPYTPQLWFFECIDMLHKLVLTSAVGFVPDAAQLPAASAFAYIYLAVVLLFRPYTRENDNWLQVATQTTLIMLLAFGLAASHDELGIKEGTINEEADVLLSLLLFALLLILLSFAVVLFFQFVRTTIREAQRKELVARASQAHRRDLIMRASTWVRSSVAFSDSVVGPRAQGSDFAVLPVSATSTHAAAGESSSSSMSSPEPPSLPPLDLDLDVVAPHDQHEQQGPARPCDIDPHGSQLSVAIEMMPFDPKQEANSHSERPDYVVNSSSSLIGSAADDLHSNQHSNAASSRSEDERPIRPGAATEDPASIPQHHPAKDEAVASPSHI